MTNKLAFIAACALLLSACSPKVKTYITQGTLTQLKPDAEIIVITEGAKVPEESQLIGSLKIGDSGFSTDCGYNTVMDHAKKAARSSGANIIAITELISPNFGSTCYKLRAKLYRNDNQEALAKHKAQLEDLGKSRLPADADYAEVHFYRPRNFQGSLIGYKVRLDNDSVIGRVRTGEKFTYRTTDFGLRTFVAYTEVTEAIDIKIEKGQEYFVRCSVSMGAAIGRPKLELIENHMGIPEYEETE